MSVELDPLFSKPVLRRAECYEKTDKLDECLSDYKKLLELESGTIAYKMKCMELERKIAERNEKLKDEMFCKF